jgi:V8-like Glu-specific endopeptidase
MFMHHLIKATGIGLSLIAMNGAIAHSQNSIALTTTQEEVLNYWTISRLQAAQPLVLPKMNNSARQKTRFNDSVPEVIEQAAPPTVEIAVATKPLFTASQMHQNASVTNAGSASEPFTSSRLIPLTADLAYPYRTVGKLFFSTPQGDRTCSAAVIRNRVVLTAGHCLHDGSGSTAGFYKNFMFIPAYRDGVAPYKQWTASRVSVTPDWLNGGGVIPNAADYGLLVMQDQIINNVSTRIAEVTGRLGYHLQAPLPTHATILGYACNFDNCEKMHQVSAQSNVQVAPNNIEIGADVKNGAGGGPWIENFGALADGQTTSYFNSVIGVTSYGYDDTSTLAIGSSLLDNRFTTLINAVCAQDARNC